MKVGDEGGGVIARVGDLVKDRVLGYGLVLRIHTDNNVMVIFDDGNVLPRRNCFSEVVRGETR